MVTFKFLNEQLTLYTRHPGLNLGDGMETLHRNAQIYLLVTH
jgi:hypothetical protein